MKLKKKFFKQRERDEVSMRGMEEKEKNRNGKSIVIFIVLLLIIFCFGNFSSSEVVAKDCSHRANGNWEYNDDQHWQCCMYCGSQLSYMTGNHSKSYSTVTSATCTSGGVRDVSCDHCGWWKRESTSALGHDYSIAATCTSGKKCSRCGATTGSPLPHTPGTTYSKNDTQHWFTCVNCGTALPKSDHTYTYTVLKEPTCVDTGSTKKVCTSCAYTATYDTPAKGHTPSSYKTSETNHWKICTVCGAEISGSRGTHADTDNDHYCNTCGYLMIIDISTATYTLTLGTTSYTYDGTARQPSVALVVEGKSLVKGTDYTVAYSNNINAGFGMVAVTGINSYEGTVRDTFTISRKKVTLNWGSTNLTYNGQSSLPTVTVNSGVTGETINLKITGAGIDAGNYIATVSIDSVTGGQANKNNYELSN